MEARFEIRAVVRRTACVALLLAGGAWLIQPPAPGAETGPKGLKLDELFHTTKVWTAHLKFTAEQWRAMQPRESGSGWGPVFGAGGPRLLGPEGKRNGLSSARGIEFDYVHADLTFEGTEFEDVAVRFKGNGTFMRGRQTGKISLKVDLNKYVKGQKLAGVTTLNFHSNVTDGSWMNEVIAHGLFRDSGVPAPRTAYARVFVTVAGSFEQEYFGLYSLVENVDDNFAKERFGNDRGAIFKPVTRRLFEDLGDDWADYNQMYDPKTDLRPEQIERVFAFSRLVSHAGEEEFARRLGEYLDLDNFSRFMATTVWMCDMDSILMNGQNFYVYLDAKTEKFRFIPWDKDNTFGQFLRNYAREQLSIERPWQGSNLFLERVFGVAAFRTLYRARLQEFSGTIYRPERFDKQVDEIAAAIRTAVRQESLAKLANLERAVSGQTVSSAMGRGPVMPLKAFVAARAKSVEAQLAGRARGL